MMDLYNGRLLIVDLTTGKVEINTLKEDFFEENVGGILGNIHLFEEYEEMDPLIIGTGPFTGTLFPGSCGGVISARSPLTGNLSHSPVTWFFTPEMKLAGFDHVVIGGAADNPSFLWIRNENAVIKEFSEDITESWEITDYLRHELGDDRVQILTTGTYGFDGGLNAQIIENYWNSFERYGFGGLMAGKNLRAIAVRGLGDILLVNPEGYMEGCLKVLNQAKNSFYYPEAFEKLVQSYGADPGIEEIKHRVDGCFNCPIPCRVFVKYNEPANELSSTDVEEPGMLLTDFETFAILRKKGLNGEKAARIMEVLSRKGIDPGVIISTKTNTYEDLLKEIEEISGIEEHIEGDLFLISQNNIANQIAAYTFGFCPVLSHMAEIVDYELFSQLILDGADIEVNMVEVEGRINKITP